MLGFLLLICSTGLISGQPPPTFHRLQDGNIKATLQGFPGLTAVTLTASSGDKEHTADMSKTADSNWWISLPDVTDEANILHYVIHYKLKDYVHETKGSARLANELTEVKVPITRRYLERRTTVVLHDDFTSGSIDPTKWMHEVSGFGGGANQVTMFTPEPANSYVKHNMLYIKPEFARKQGRCVAIRHLPGTSLKREANRCGAARIACQHQYTIDFANAYVKCVGFEASAGSFVVSWSEPAAIWGTCSSIDHRGCYLSGHGKIPPIMTARLKSKASIKYGKVTVNARLPRGDWLWPAIWLLPTEYKYGPWPRSGEIDIMESRGNQNYHNHWGHHESMGTDYTHAAIHYGWRWGTANKKFHAGEFRITDRTFADSFHSWWMDWTADYIRLGVDDHTVLAWDTPAQGYWQEGHFPGQNIWASGNKDAPFDRPFYLILNVNAGGGWFWEGMKNAAYPQPWHDNATKAEQFIQFWNARHLWQPTWHGENVAMRIRSVTMEQY